MKKIAIIYGSSRPSNRGKIIAEWLKANSDLDSELIDLKEVNLPLLDEAMPPIANQYQNQHTKEWSEMIKPFDGYIFVVAEYNLGYTAILKNAVDSLFHEWNGKPAAIVSYGSFPVSTAGEQFRTVLAPFKMKVSEERVHVAPIAEATKDGELNTDFVDGEINKLFEQLKKNLAD